MFNLPLCAILCVIVNKVAGNFNGPFLFWGLDGLKTYKISALDALDDKPLQELYTDATAVILFLRNATNRLSTESYPTFKGIIDKSEWVYSPQHVLSSDPVDYNLNAEVIHLVGPTSQEDVEMSALYRDAELSYGKGKVLGILATKWDGHKLFKREATDEPPSAAPPPSPASPSSSVESPSASPSVIPSVIPSASPTTLPSASTTTSPDDDKYDEDYVYYKEKAACLYTTSPPLLKKITETTVNGNTTEKHVETVELKFHGYVATDDRENLYRLIVTFKNPKDTSKIIIRFRFRIYMGYWTLSSLELESNTTLRILTIEGEAPSAPIGFSYHCSAKPTVFRDESRTETITIENIQVEAKMNKKGFNDAYDCIGFTTAPIWSGLLVSFIMLGGLGIAICAILDIKPPNRFENSRNKQLTFTIQE